MSLVSHSGEFSGEHMLAEKPQRVQRGGGEVTATEVKIEIGI